jgi:glycosyltransferase involved in cell wall biosynthesis
MSTSTVDNQVLFSVIIPTYNYGHTLGRAVDSVLAQEGGNDYEIIIADDGSTDETSKVAESYCEQYPEKMSYHYQENQGPAAARNNGIDSSVGEYIFLLDADDEMAEGILDVLRQYISKAGQIDFLVGDHLVIDPGGRVSYSAVRALPKTREQRFSQFLTKKLHITHCAKLVHRKVFDTIRYPADLRSSEDIPFLAQALALFDCESISVPMAVMHKHNDSLRHNVVYARQAGEKVVDYVFCDKLLPSWAKKYENSYRARRCLSIFRTLHLSGNNKESLIYYKKALRLAPFLALKPSYIKKVIKALVGF